MHKNKSLLIILLIFTLKSSLLINTSNAEISSKKLPNILLLITDDQRYDDLYGVMDYTEKEIFKKGVAFENAFVTTPACCPSRSSIFTGLYASGHAVIGNRYELRKKTFIEVLKDKYYTALIGKM